ncbi:FUSC family protein [Chryseobacterium sp. A301]
MRVLTGVRNFLFSSISIYIYRCVLGFTLGYYLMELVPEFDLFWALLSIMLVISPEGKDAPRLTTDRVKANLVGALSGFVVVFLPFELFWKTLIGIVVAALLSNAFKLSSVSRTAIVAVIIIVLEKPDEGYIASIERFLSVAGGCLIGLFVVVSTGYLIRYLHKLILKVEFRHRDDPH